MLVSESCSFCFHHQAKYFGLFPMRRKRYLWPCLKNSGHKPEKVGSSGRCIFTATAAQKEAQRAAPINATPASDINKTLASRQRARRQANMWETNQGEHLVVSGTLQHHQGKTSRKTKGHSKGKKTLRKPERQHKTQLLSPQRGHWLVASGLTDGPFFYAFSLA